jgi:O-methyltransferase
VEWNKDRTIEAFKESFRGFFVKKQILMIRYTGGDRDAALERARQVKAERKSFLSHGDICQIISAVQATRQVPGDLVEFGVAYGASARIIAEYGTAGGTGNGAGRTLHLFDTFEGLPEPGPNDSARFCKGSYGCSLESVQQYLTGLPVVYHKGFFPQTAGGLRDTVFAFVHLDVDLYQSTLEGLKFFYPRMSRGGIILSHDYKSSAGVDQAFQEFFADKPEPVIGLSGYQCLVVKL